jgi:hypothetical protein
MTNSWIEPPPPQRGMGCFAKGCLILISFFIVLGIAFIGGTYVAVRYLKSEYFPTTGVQLPANAATEMEQQTVRARWTEFENAARARQPARVEFTADELNALIASKPKLRGKAYVSIDNNTAQLRLSARLNDVRWLKGHYVNAECAIQSAPSKDPRDARITRIVVNGRQLGDEVLRWQYRSWSLRYYLTEWMDENDLKTFEIADNKIILETKGSGE